MADIEMAKGIIEEGIHEILEAQKILQKGGAYMGKPQMRLDHAVRILKIAISKL